MPNFKDSFGGDTFKAADQPDGWAQRLTISDVGEKTFEDQKNKTKEKKLILSFREDPRSLVCNWTNANEIAKSYGDDTDGWLNRQIQLYKTTTKFGKDTVPCIRVRGPKSGQDAPPPPDDWGAPPDSEPGDPGPLEEDW